MEQFKTVHSALSYFSSLKCYDRSTKLNEKI